AGRAEANDGLTAVARATWPFQLSRRMVLEPSIAAFTGRYVLTSDLRSTGLRGPRDWEFADERVLGTIALQARPFGLLAEYNVGRGPQYDPVRRGPQYDPVRDSVVTKRLAGGFVTANWVIAHRGQQFLPFVRWQAYDGGKRHERDARAHRVRDLEVGVEWQASRNFELVAEYYLGDRVTADRALGVNPQTGRLLRLQAQVNY
ncbi:MAG: OprO/OprP family phosphate-selective porin, partial [Gemmatimonadaceae bacterium]|nr:OprO/OprP family phosphate-selective porin [Gemmatimonadaceae bacterium]MCU0627374.1 OprO/OprP family phosphate-selective porin [Gemmatimonadaceae bacterium]